MGTEFAAICDTCKVWCDLHKLAPFMLLEDSATSTWSFFFERFMKFIGKHSEHGIRTVNEHRDDYNLSDDPSWTLFERADWENYYDREGEEDD